MPVSEIYFSLSFKTYRVLFYYIKHLKTVIETYIMNNFYYTILSIDILYSVFGLPSECIHNNVIRSCTLSFSCWMQGGHYVDGCGENKWLLSCCISETETHFNSAIPYNGPIRSAYSEHDLNSIKSQQMPSSMHTQNMLRRRMDDFGMVKLYNFIVFSLLYSIDFSDQ